MTIQGFGLLHCLVHMRALTSYDVDLEAGMCSCQGWQVAVIPRSYVLDWEGLREKGLENEEYYDEHLLADNFRTKYVEFFFLIIDMNLQIETVQDIVVKPPR